MIFTAYSRLIVYMRRQCQLDHMKTFKVPTLNKNKKEKDSTKKRKGFSVSLNRFELGDVIDLKIIVKLALKLLMSQRVSQEYRVLQLSY